MAVKLEKPLSEGKVSVEEAIKARRTVRSFDQGAITPEELATLCWAGQGITGANSIYRAAPSAGALYPIFLYVAIGPQSVPGIKEGTYLYIPKNHSLDQVKSGDARRKLARAALEQMWMSHPAVMFLVAADYKRITPKYGRRGIPYAHYEAGHVAENILAPHKNLWVNSGIGRFPRT